MIFNNCLTVSSCQMLLSGNNSVGRRKLWLCQVDTAASVLTSEHSWQQGPSSARDGCPPVLVIFVFPAVYALQNQSWILLAMLGLSTGLPTEINPCPLPVRCWLLQSRISSGAWSPYHRTLFHANYPKKGLLDPQSGLSQSEVSRKLENFSHYSK